jgi:hypothetical protein
MSGIFWVNLSAYSLTPQETTMFRRFQVWSSQQGQSLSIALLAFLFCGALLLGFL